MASNRGVETAKLRRMKWPPSTGSKSSPARWRLGVAQQVLAEGQAVAGQVADIGED